MIINLLLFALIFMLGLSIGSFINALEYRIEEDKTIGGRSFCPHCKHQLSWHDLFPLLSFIFLRGKCRYCHDKISFQYPVVEFLTGLSFIGVFWRLGVPVDTRSSLVLVLTLFIVSVAVLVGLHDFKTSYVLSGWVYAGVFAALLAAAIKYTGAFAWEPISHYASPIILSAFIPGLLFYSLYFFSKGKWMGEGEYELATLMGLTLGFPLVVPAYYFAFITGSLVGLMLVYISKKKKMNSELAFGPFLMAGLIFALIFGQQIVNYYARIFLG